MFFHQKILVLYVHNNDDSFYTISIEYSNNIVLRIRT